MDEFKNWQTVQRALLEREVTKPESSTGPMLAKETDSTPKLASEEKKLDLVPAEASIVEKPVNRRRRRKRKKARGPRVRARLNATKTGA